MRVLLVGDYPPPQGGVAIHVQQLHRFLDERGVHVRGLDIGKGGWPAAGVVAVRSARMLAQEGARLCLLARDEDELTRAAGELAQSGAEVLPIRCDVRRRADLRAAVDRILDRWSVIDVLINNAGVIQVGPLEHMTTEDFENAMATHLSSALSISVDKVERIAHDGKQVITALYFLWAVLVLITAVIRRKMFEAFVEFPRLMREHW